MILTVRRILRITRPDRFVIARSLAIDGESGTAHTYDTGIRRRKLDIWLIASQAGKVGAGVGPAVATCDKDIQVFSLRHCIEPVANSSADQQ